MGIGIGGKYPLSATIRAEGVEQANAVEVVEDANETEGTSATSAAEQHTQHRATEVAKGFFLANARSDFSICISMGFGRDLWGREDWASVPFDGFFSISISFWIRSGSRIDGDRLDIPAIHRAEAACSWFKRGR